MSTPVHYITLAEYNQWMNQKLYATCAQISDEKRKENLGAFFQSIHATLNHLLYGDRAWMGRFTNQPFYTPGLGVNLYDGFDQLRHEREQMDRTILAWANTLSDEWLQQPFTYTSNIDQVTRILPTWVLVTHMFNHQTHHRGQVTTLLSQLGLDVGTTDLPWLPTLVSPASSNVL